MSKRTNKIYLVRVVKSAYMNVEADSPEEAMKIADAYADRHITDEDFIDSDLSVASCDSIPGEVTDCDKDDKIFTADGVFNAKEYWEKCRNKFRKTEGAEGPAMTRNQLFLLRPGCIVTMSDGIGYKYLETRRHMVCLQQPAGIEFSGCKPKNRDTTPFWMDYHNIKLISHDSDPFANEWLNNYQ